MLLAKRRSSLHISRGSSVSAYASSASGEDYFFPFCVYTSSAALQLLTAFAKWSKLAQDKWPSDRV